MTRHPRFFMILSLGIMLICGRLSANVINGSFEAGMASWTTVGPNSAVPNGQINGYNATDGAFYAYIHNGVGAQATFVQDFVLQSVVGLPANYIGTTFTGATQGSILFQTFTLNPGNDAISFDWNFLTDENPQSATFNDFAFAHLFDSTASLVGSAYVDTFSPLPNSSGSEYFLDTGWQSVSFGGLVPGSNYSLVFGVFDREDTIVDSALLVDNIRSVPEPGSVALIGLAGVLMGFRRRSVR